MGVYGRGWEKAGGDMFRQNATSEFIHRGVDCWTKRINSGAWKGTHNGYFRMMIPGVNHQQHIDQIFMKNGGLAAMPNGGRFTYLVMTDRPDEVVAGFDGTHDVNINAPLRLEEAEAQLRRVVDFLLDHGLGRPVPANA